MGKIEVYLIYNIATDKVYIGQSVNTKERFRRHKSLLRKNKHHCQHLQNSWNVYHEHNFFFFVVCECESQNEADTIEQFYIQWYKAIGLCYNPSWNHGGRGEVSLETREKLRQANLGKKLTESTKQKISKIHKGRIMPSHVKASLLLKNSKEFVIFSPEKISFSGINRAKFCKEHGLNIGNFNEVLAGKRKHHKGWTLDIQAEYHTSYKLMSPDGRIIEKKHVKDFCDEFGLIRQHLYRLIKGELHQYKGWKRP